MKSGVGAKRAWAAIAVGSVIACSSVNAPENAAPSATTTPPATTSNPPADAATTDAAPAAEPFDLWRRQEPIYELYVRHFSPEGNFKGVEARLPELEALGVGIVWLLPIHAIGSITPANGGQAIDAPHGNPYAIKSYEDLNPEYGSLKTAASAEADLKSLVAHAHALGMHVIIDWVPNHTAWDNPLVTSHPDWYVHENGAIKPVSPEFAWIAQLDWSKPALREYMTNAMASFVSKFDVDGFRIDFAHAMPVDFFAQLRTRLETIKPVFLLAESGAANFHPTFDMTYDWDVYPLLGDVAQGKKNVSAIDDALYFNQLVPYAGTNDALVMRMTYNHDDNGVFKLGDRYGAGIRTFAVLACTLPGKPLVFNGQEVGMRVFDGATVQASIPLGHDPIVKIDWSDPEGYRPFYTKLLRLFQANPALHHAGMGDFRKIDTSPASPVYSFVRRDGTNTVLVVLNLSGNDLPSVILTPHTNAGSIDGTYVELFTGASESVTAGKVLHLAPWEYRVYVQGAVALE